MITISPSRRAPLLCGDPNDPHGLYVWLQRYLSWLAVRNDSPITIEQRTLYLSLFVSWADARALARPGDIDKRILEATSATCTCCARSVTASLNLSLAVHAAGAGAGLLHRRRYRQAR